MYITDLITVIGYLHTAGFRNRWGINCAKCTYVAERITNAADAVRVIRVARTLVIVHVQVGLPFFADKEFSLTIPTYSVMIKVLYAVEKILKLKVSFIIFRHCRMHWPCWLRTWGGASSLTKMVISQSAPITFASGFTLVTLALCAKCRRTLKGLYKHKF